MPRIGPRYVPPTPMQRRLRTAKQLTATFAIFVWAALNLLLMPALMGAAIYRLLKGF